MIIDAARYRFVGRPGYYSLYWQQQPPVLSCPTSRFSLKVDYLTARRFCVQDEVDDMHCFWGTVWRKDVGSGPVPCTYVVYTANDVNKCKYVLAVFWLPFPLFSADPRPATPPAFPSFFLPRPVARPSLPHCQSSPTHLPRAPPPAAAAKWCIGLGLLRSTEKTLSAPPTFFPNSPHT